MPKRQPRTVWTEPRIAEFRDLWLAGWSYAALAKHFGVTEKAIEGARLCYDLPPRRRGNHRPGARVTVVTLPAMPQRAASAHASDIPWPTRERLMGRR